MILDPRTRRFLRLSGLNGWFTGERLRKIQEAFLAALFADKCGATFRNPPITKEKR